MPPPCKLRRKAGQKVGGPSAPSRARRRRDAAWWPQRAGRGFTSSEIVGLSAARSARPPHGRPTEGSARMPKVVLMHAVEDVDRWLEGKAERAEAIGQIGTNVTDYVAQDGSNRIAITADVHDMAGAEAMMTSPSPEVAAVMEKHGVVQPITAYVEAP